MTQTPQTFSPVQIPEGDYLKKLADIEKILPSLLENSDDWKTVDVDYHPPKVERILRQWNDLRIYLHRIYPAKVEKTLFHPHPWPSAMRILKGAYQMGIGYGENPNDPPSIASTLILPEGAFYEMVQPHAWHYVCPVNEVTYSLMIAGRPWQGREQKSDLVLHGLAESTKDEILQFFRKKYFHE